MKNISLVFFATFHKDHTILFQGSHLMVWLCALRIHLLLVCGENIYSNSDNMAANISPPIFNGALEAIESGVRQKKKKIWMKINEILTCV